MILTKSYVLSPHINPKTISIITMLSDRVITTRKGNISIKSTSPSRISNIRKASPLGLIALHTKNGEQAHGVVIKCGNEEARCLKQQTVEYKKSEQQTIMIGNMIHLANGVANYIKHGFGGILIPLIYCKDKGENGLEIGFAYFGAPSTSGMEATEFPAYPSYDDTFGHGFLTMFKHFYDGMKNASKTIFPLAPVIGLDIRQSSQLGNIVMPCIIHGTSLYLCSQKLDQYDYFLNFLSDAGITEAFHLPAIAMPIEEHHRLHAKE